MRKFEFDYDRDNDDLFIYDKNVKSTASVEVSDLVLDFHRTKGLAGIEIMKATRFLNNLITDLKLSRNSLSGMLSCKVESKTVNNMLFVKMILFMKEDRQVPINLSIPSITRPSPVLSAA